MAHNKTITTNKLVRATTKRFRITDTGNNDDDEADELKTALSIPDTFAGTCYHCGKPGHRKTTVRSSRGPKGERGSGGTAIFVVNMDTRKTIAGKKMRMSTNVHTIGYQG